MFLGGLGLGRRIAIFAGNGHCGGGGKGACLPPGKVVEFVMPYGPGGGYDTWARLVTPFLAKHTGATVIVENEAGAGGKVAVNRLQKEHNGLSLVSFSVQSLILDQIYQMPGCVMISPSLSGWVGSRTRLIPCA